LLVTMRIARQGRARALHSVGVGAMVIMVKERHSCTWMLQRWMRVESGDGDDGGGTTIATCTQMRRCLAAQRGLQRTTARLQATAAAIGTVIGTVAAERSRLQLSLDRGTVLPLHQPTAPVVPGARKGRGGGDDGTVQVAVATPRRRRTRMVVPCADQPNTQRMVVAKALLPKRAQHVARKRWQRLLQRPLAQPCIRASSRAGGAGTILPTTRVRERHRPHGCAVPTVASVQTTLTMRSARTGLR